MSTTWTQPAQALISEATAGWEGIWSLTYAAGFGALNLAMSVPLGVGVSISYAAMDFRDAQDELEWARPNLRATAAAVRLGLTSQRDGLPANERAAIALATGIEALVGEARAHPSQLAPATTPWLRAALHLRAASDLVATHFHPDGRTRTPDAAATDTRAFDAGLVDLGH